MSATDIVGATRIPADPPTSNPPSAGDAADIHDAQCHDPLSTTISHQSSSADVPIVVPSVSVMPITPSIDADTINLLRAYDYQLRAAIANHSMIGKVYYSWRVKRTADNSSWLHLGYSDDRAYHNALGIERRHWTDYLRIARTLEALPFSELSAIGFFRARALVTVNPDIWADYDWLREAKTVPVQKFLKLVKERNSGECMALESGAIVIPDDGGAVSVLLEAAKESTKLIRLAEQSLRSGQVRKSKFGAEALRLIDKAKRVMHGALNEVAKRSQSPAQTQSQPQS